jgi:hypothetical protein
MKSILCSYLLLAMMFMLGCSKGNGIPMPEDTPGWDPVKAYVSSIKRETMSVVALAESNPREANAQADAVLENFDDSADTGEYAETIAQIKETLRAMADGKGKATGLKELAAKLPGDLPAQGGNR